MKASTIFIIWGVLASAFTANAQQPSITDYAKITQEACLDLSARFYDQIRKVRSELELCQNADATTATVYVDCGGKVQTTMWPGCLSINEELCGLKYAQETETEDCDRQLRNSTFEKQYLFKQARYELDNLRTLLSNPVAYVEKKFFSIVSFDLQRHLRNNGNVSDELFSVVDTYVRDGVEIGVQDPVAQAIVSSSLDELASIHRDTLQRLDELQSLIQQFQAQ